METETLVSVGGRPIAVAAIRREAQYHPAQSWSQACYEATRALVIRELMLGEAIAQGQWDGEQPLSERQCQEVVERVVQQSVAVPQVSDAACEDFYRDHSGKFLGPELFEASHILLATSNDESERRLLRARAAEVLTQLQREPARFERLARELSICPSATSGGRLGQLTAGETDLQFETSLRQLQAGELHPRLLETRHGFHIIRLDEYSAGRVLPYSAVRERIRVYLRERAWREAMREFVRDLAVRQELRGFDLDSPPPPEQARAAVVGTDGAVATGAVATGVAANSAAGNGSATPLRRLPVLH